jgi:tetratricopeptide (TPR) repeat protein
MIEEPFEIQCESCSTLYSSMEEVCPYCGQPRPLFEAEDSLGYDDDYPLENDLAGEAEPYPPYEDKYKQDYHPQPGYANYTDEPVALTYPGYELYNQAYHPADIARHASEADEPDFDEADYLPAEVAQPRRFTWRRTMLGCFGTLLCIGVFYGAIALVAAYQGLQEQTLAKQNEAIEHYQRGQQHLTNNSLELAIAEFELAVSLNPNLLEAREALREAKRIAQALPTPTSQTRSDAAVETFQKAEEQIQQQNWADAAQTLLQVRDLDSTYQPEQVSELLYQANFQLGLQLVTLDTIEQAVQAFDQALSERPDDAQATLQRSKAALYLEGRSAEATDPQRAAKAFDQLFRDDANYLDVKERVLRAFELLGDELVAQKEWCQAEAQYLQALQVATTPSLQSKADSSHQLCQEQTAVKADNQATPTTPPKTPIASSSAGANLTNTPALTRPTPAASQPIAAGGSIYYSFFNPNEARWEILAVPAGGGAPRVAITNATMPAVSPDGRWLIYHSELLDSEGFHRFDLTNGDDTRITLFKRDILPRWGPDSSRFVFVAQEPATGRWQAHLGFIDGKSEPIILRDGRTPDWSPTGNLLAYQGTDAGGNNPGIYVVPFDGGESVRLTNHESDRSPDFSPDGLQLAYMSTKGGNWDIYTVSSAGSAPRQLTIAPGQDGLPAWSPDGSKIAFVSDAGGSWGIYVVDAAGGVPQKIAAWDGTNLPDWLLAQIWWGK